MRIVSDRMLCDVRTLKTNAKTVEIVNKPSSVWYHSKNNL